jgi:uncharacterized heparinase superfamily protein
MPKLSLGERAGLARLLVDRGRRAAAANLLQSPMLRWRYGTPVADQLLIVPQDLRTADPSVWSEIRLGHFGLAGAVAVLDDGSPFALTPSSEAWARELHGFGWLRHLAAAQDPEAKETAVGYVLDWIDRHRSRQGVAWQAAVVGRRIMSWVSHAGLLLESLAPDSYDRIAESLGSQMVHLSAAWRNAPDGYPRLVALTALVLADLCVANHDRQLDDVEGLFSAEIDRQVLADGGHVGRNPSTVVELLLDFLPLGQCFSARRRDPPKALARAIARMLPFVRFMRLGDGTLGRFNGMGAPQIDALATVLAYDDRPRDVLAKAGASRYLRLERGGSIVLVDAGPPPPLRLAGEAHAGCLSFEMSTGSRPLLVNGGAPGLADESWRAAARATVSHNTLCLGAKSSSRLVRSRMLESLVGAAPIRLPTRVTAREGASAEGAVVEAQHDGYLRTFGLMHGRQLTLSESGDRLDGIDRLAAPGGSGRPKRDWPFSIHFHLAPAVTCTPAEEANTADLEPGDGSVWRFTAQGAEMSFEDGVFFADLSGPRRTLQLVLRAACFGRSEVRWSLARRFPAPGAEARTADRMQEPGPRAVPPPLPKVPQPVEA